jgi:putative spermidine/putrescine transport system permease protein
VRPARFEWVFIGVAVATLVFMAAPLLVVIPEGFSSASYMVFPPPGYSLQWFENFLATGTWTSALATSIQVATLSALLATIMGTLAALGLDGIGFRGKGVVMIVLLSPLLIPIVIIGIATYTAFLSVGLRGSIPALVLAHALLGLPFVFLTVSASLSQYDIRIKAAAQSLGAGPMRAFFEVTLPLIAPGVITGAILAFAVSFDDVVIATFLAGVRTETLPMRMVSAITYEFDPTIAAVSVVLLTFAGAMFLSLLVLRRLRSRYTPGSA